MAPVHRKLRSPRAHHARIDHLFERIARGVLIVYMIWALVVWVSERNAFRIDTINVVGARVMSEEEITLLAQELMIPRLLGGISRANTIFAPMSTIARAILSESEWIKNVDVFAGDHALEIILEEREPSLLWCPAPNDLSAASTSEHVFQIFFEGCYFADSEGYVFGTAPVYTGYPFVVYVSTATSSGSTGATGTPMTIGGYILSVDELKRISRLRELLLDRGIVTHQVLARDPGDYLLHVDRPWKLFVSTSVEPEEIVRRLELVENEIGKEDTSTTPVSIIDLRFGNKIFYR